MKGLVVEGTEALADAVMGRLRAEATPSPRRGSPFDAR